MKTIETIIRAVAVAILVFLALYHGSYLAGKRFEQGRMAYHATR